MLTKITNLYDRMQASYWFIPSIMAVQAVAFSTLMLYLDLLNSKLGFLDQSWINLTGACGAQNLLATDATSMITVTWEVS